MELGKIPRKKRQKNQGEGRENVRHQWLGTMKYVRDQKILVNVPKSLVTSVRPVHVEST